MQLKFRRVTDNTPFLLDGTFMVLFCVSLNGFFVLLNGPGVPLDGPLVPGSFP